MIAALLLGWSVQEGPPLPPAIESDPGRQSVAAMAIAILTLLLVLELVRRRKLREEYSVLWVLAGAVLLGLALLPDLVLGLTRLLGATTPTSTLFLGALVFLLMVCLQFSVRISRLTQRSKALIQRMALLEEDARELRRELDKARTVARDPGRRTGPDRDIAGGGGAA